MKKFPNKMIPSNENKFKEYLYNRNICFLRKEIYEFILRKIDNNDFFNISEFDNKYINNREITYKMISEIIIELENIGWICSLYYGNTGLFIYNKDNKPSILEWGEEF